MGKMHKPCHPGEILADTLDSLAITVDDFAKSINESPSTLHQIVLSVSPMTSEIATKINNSISGLSVQTWLRLQNKYDRWDEKR